MKEYIEDRVAPFKLEVSKIFTNINNAFGEENSMTQTLVSKSIRNLQTIHESIVKKYAQLKVVNNKNEAKIESQTNLTKHLDNISLALRDKDEISINLKTQIKVMESKLETLQGKLKSTTKDESLIEQEWRELSVRIKDNEKLLDVHINNNKELEFNNKSLNERINDLEKEMFEYKFDTQKLMGEKNSELIELRSRLGIIDQEYTDKINLLLMEKNKLQGIIDIEASEAELLTMKLSVLSNKVKTVIEQKGFLLENVESCVDNLKQEWDKLKDN
jgi:chromosome segregation ATPase